MKRRVPWWVAVLVALTILTWGFYALGLASRELAESADTPAEKIKRINAEREVGL